MENIVVRNVSKSYGELKAVDNVSFSVDKNELFGLLGPNGAGKSTMISMITTLLQPDSGNISVGGHDVKSSTMEVKKIIGLVPQEIALYPTLTAKENLAFWGRMHGLGGKTLKQRIDNALSVAGLEERANEKIEKYSGGMKRRINIAAALLHRPEVLIMDEPTVGIDPQSRNHILETVLELNREGITFIYTSHYMEEVEYLCSRVAIMDHGKIIASGTKDELKSMVDNKETVIIQAQNLNEGIQEKVEQLEGVDGAAVGEEEIRIMTGDADLLLAKIITELESRKAGIKSIRVEEPNLENVFLHLTGRALRD